MPVFWSQTSQYYSSMKLGNILKDSNLRTQTKETFNPARHRRWTKMGNYQ